MKILDLLKQSDTAFKRHLIFFLSTYFLVLFNYPLIRASSTTLFFEAFGARNSPQAWLWAILFLTLTIYLCNRLQARLPVQWVFLLVSLFSAGIFLSTSWGQLSAYLAFVWKEIYIVIQVHLLLAYANNYFRKEHFKIMIGPLGAVGSLGGIAGGLLTSWLGQQGGTQLVMSMGSLVVLAPALFFLKTSLLRAARPAAESSSSPLAALGSSNVKRYVAYLATLVALTQFVINILDFQFNLALEAAITLSDERTSYLGQIYTLTNLFTFLLQSLLLTWILPRISEQKLHLFIPLSFLCLLALFMGWQWAGLWPVAWIYIYVKAADYSLFSAGKELLYQPLLPLQKYGAKYLNDMLTYRLAKAVIATVLIYLQSSLMLNMLMVIFLLFWLIMVIKLFRLQSKLF